MSGLRTPLLIKCWYCFVVMTILYSLPTLDSVKLNNNQSTIPTQASSNTTALPTLRPSLFLTPILYLPPTIVSTTSSLITHRSHIITTVIITLTGVAGIREFGKNNCVCIDQFT